MVPRNEIGFCNWAAICKKYFPVDPAIDRLLQRNNISLKDRYRVLMKSKPPADDRMEKRGLPGTATRHLVVDQVIPVHPIANDAKK